MDRAIWLHTYAVLLCKLIGSSPPQIPSLCSERMDAPICIDSDDEVKRSPSSELPFTMQYRST